MNEKTPNIVEAEGENEKEARKLEKFALAREIIGNLESFPGIIPEVYSKMKAEEEEFPSYATPIDDLIKRFEDEGTKVVFVPGDNPENGNVFVLPGESEDIENDSMLPCKLQISEAMDEKLKKLILLDRD